MSSPAPQASGGKAGEESFSDLLATRQFLCLMAASFIAYANISVFFGFYDHLQSLPVARADFGILIGALAACALVVRPLISPFVHADNARALLMVGTTLAVASLLAYSLADSFWSILFVRLGHGLSFAIVGCSLMTLIVEVIPKNRSAQFFGYIAVITLIPNTLVPPFLPWLAGLLGGFNNILLAFAALTLLLFPLVWAVGGPKSKTEQAIRPGRLQGWEIRQDLADGRVLLILVAMLMLYCGNALIFFFLDGYGRSIGLAFAGGFLTLSTLGEIGIRLIAGGAFDRMAKVKLATWIFFGLALCYLALAHVAGRWQLFSLGLLFGFGWGIAMPVLNGLMFDVSPTRFRAFNINLGMQMFQAGYFLGPIIGAPLLARWGYGSIYSLCAAMSGVAMLLFCSARLRRRGATSQTEARP